MFSTGIGSMPGEDARDYTEALRVVLGTLTLPHVPELPGRGAAASLTGRALAVVAADLGADLQPAGWRLTGSGGGVDQRRAVSLLAQDLDAVEERTQGWTGPLKTQIAGPWTLAATVERPRGDRVLADHGARRELAEALAAGLTEHIADLRRRVPGATWLVQVDEPALPAVLGARVPTASGFGRHRSVDAQAASAALEGVFAAITGAGATPIVHCCAEDAPLDLLRRTGAQGFAVDTALLDAAATDLVAEAIEAGLWVVLGAAVTTGGVEGSAVARRVERFLDLLGLEPGERLAVSAGCGLAGLGAPEAVRTLTAVAEAARSLTT